MKGKVKARTGKVFRDKPIHSTVHFTNEDAREDQREEGFTLGHPAKSVGEAGADPGRLGMGGTGDNTFLFLILCIFVSFVPCHLHGNTSCLQNTCLVLAAS